MAPATDPMLPAPAGRRAPEERRAIVVGAGVAGLLAARVLVEHFDRVAVVERDALPAGPDFRPGVPQSRHIHALFVRGRQLLERLLPGLGDELVAAGAVPLEWPADVLWYGPGGWGGRFRAGLRTYSCSRELLEWGIRRGVARSPRVAFVSGHHVVGLVPAPAHEAVGGVLLAPRGRSGAPGAPSALEADLVVDASGRDSRAPEWLAALGYPRPTETTVNAFLGYASRWYAPPPGHRADWKGVVIQRRPPRGTRSGAVWLLEGGRWMVTLGGAGRDYPPTDEAGFLAFARDLAHPLLYEALEHAEPISPIRGYRRTENRLRHYERLRLPERFVVLGDAACAFNPVWGCKNFAGRQAARSWRCSGPPSPVRPRIGPVVGRMGRRCPGAGACDGGAREQRT